jgi:hypothetical protein
MGWRHEVRALAHDRQLSLAAPSVVFKVLSGLDLFIFQISDSQILMNLDNFGSIFKYLIIFNIFAK